MKNICAQNYRLAISLFCFNRMEIALAATLLMSLAPVTHSVTTYNTGAGILYTLKVVKD